MKARPSGFTRVPDRTTDPDHHLWRNGQVWWIAFTYHTSDGRKRRLRASLGTRNLDAARIERDQLLANFEHNFGHLPSLRFASLTSSPPPAAA